MRDRLAQVVEEEPKEPEKLRKMKFIAEEPLLPLPPLITNPHNSKLMLNAIITIGIGTMIPEETEFQFCTFRVLDNANLVMQEIQRTHKICNSQILYADCKDEELERMQLLEDLRKHEQI